MNQTSQKGACRNDNRPRFKDRASANGYAFDSIVIGDNILNHSLAQRQIGRALNDTQHGLGVFLLIGLSSGRLYSWAFATIQQLELYSRLVDVLGHLTAQGIDLSYELPFCYSTDGRVAGHFRDAVEINCEKERVHSHASSRKSCFTSGMSSANNNYVMF